MPDDLLTSFIVAAEGLAPQVAVFAEEGERSRRLPLPLVEADGASGSLPPLDTARLAGRRLIR